MNIGQAGGIWDRYNGEVQGSLPVIQLGRLHAGLTLIFGMSGCLAQVCSASHKWMIFGHKHIMGIWVCGFAQAEFYKLRFTCRYTGD